MSPAYSLLSDLFFAQSRFSHRTLPHLKPSYTQHHQLTRPFMDTFPSTSAPKQSSPDKSRDSRFELVGRCKYRIWHWCCPRQILRGMEICPRFSGRSKESLQHWLGRGSSSGAWSAPRNSVPTPSRQQHTGAFRQLWNCHSREQGPVQEP